MIRDENNLVYMKYYYKKEEPVDVPYWFPSNLNRRFPCRRKIPRFRKRRRRRRRTTNTTTCKSNSNLLSGSIILPSLWYRTTRRKPKKYLVKYYSSWSLSVLFTFRYCTSNCMGLSCWWSKALCPELYRSECGI